MVPVVNELLKSNLALRVFSALFLAGVTIVGLFHGSPLFEALLFIAFLFLMYELKKLPFKGQGSLFVALYLVISFLSVYWLFDFDSTTLLWLFCIVWSSDIGGYCAGKFFGGPKVLPKVSPNKTWAGVLGACFLTFFSLILL
ncbi:MAG: phosphatidate cytidylyltransferase, partial [Pseudomonadota bacterium]|nr:phosphatidate cytidylyltransferase [Pseudomonadota bacterium]